MIAPVFLRIWLVTSLLGIGGFPVVFLVFRRLPDRGYALSRYIALLVVTYLAWLLGHVGVPFDARSVGSLTALYLAFNAVLLFVNFRDIMRFVREHARTLILLELVFFFALAIVLKIISHNARIDPDSERMMDYAMIHGILKFKLFPQWDLWFAGQYVNYYYFGFAIAAALKLLTGLELPVLFNAVIGFVYAALLVSAVSLGYNFTRRHLYGLLTGLLMVVVGNLNACVQIVQGSGLFAIDWFASARVIEGTVNEFPYFSLMWGDPHSYVFAFPIALIALSFGLNILFEKDGQVTLFVRGVRANLLPLALAAVTVGALIPTNTWDFPAYMAAIGLAFGVRSFVRTELSLGTRIRRTVLPALLVGVTAVVAYSPYLMAFRQKRGFRWVSFSRSAFTDFFQIFGVYAIITLACMLIVVLLWHAGRPRRQRLMLLLFGLTAILFACRQTTFLHLAVFAILAIGILVRLLMPEWFAAAEPPAFLDGAGERREQTGRLAYVVALAALAAAYGLGCEFFYVNDHYSDKLERMNTVFKVYLEMWFIWSAAASFAVCLVAGYLRGAASRRYRVAWFGLIAVLVALGLVYTVAATYIRTGRFQSDSTLDGMKENRLSHAADCRAIEWMRQNIDGMPTILEAHGHAYVWASRFATFAGFPTLLGWGNHESGWRGTPEVVMQRMADIDLVYTTTDIDAARQVLDKHDVRYVIVGQIERERYPAAGLSKFGTFMQVVYTEADVTVFYAGRESRAPAAAPPPGPWQAVP